MTAKEFLTPEEQNRVISAIKQAEKDTSGEIRIHIEDICDRNPMDTAKKIFHHIGMDRTQQRNGVLIYVACQSKVFAIIGDKGINEKVPANFWNDISEQLSSDFKQGKFADGLAAAVGMTGEKLKKFFPYESDDINEQPDDLSFGK